MQNVPSGYERGETDVFAGYISPTGEVFSKEKENKETRKKS